MSEELARLEKKIDDHAAKDDLQFIKLASSLDLHEANTATRHAQNQALQATMTAKLDRVETAIGTIDTLLPAIKVGIQEDERRIYRKKLFRRVAVAILSTLVTISALVPLLNVMAGLRISVHVVQ